MVEVCVGFVEAVPLSHRALDLISPALNPTPLQLKGLGFRVCEDSSFLS